MSDIPKLDRNDYTDPQCPFCTDQYQKEPPVRAIPTSRVISKLEEHLGRNDYAAAERHLKYWLAEAKNGRDRRGEFTLRNELMGLYRKLGRREEALDNAHAALDLMRELGIGETTAGGTAYVNAATVCKAFGMPKEAMEYFGRAREIYEKLLPPDDGRLGGLYNNTALALVDLARYDEAFECYRKALAVMERTEGGALEQAITYLNMANAYELRDGLEDASDDVESCLDTAQELLDSDGVPHNGYYAFVCEKCAPTFKYYGRFAFARELADRAEKIYARS